MIQIQHINLSFGEQDVFKDVTTTINPYDRIGLVGRNGAGKSTLLKAIAGTQPLDSGTINVIGVCTVAYMPQDIVIASTLNIVEEALTSFEHLEPEDEPAAIAEVKKMLMGLGFSLERLEKTVDQLSTGWKMRLVLAKLLLKKADFYLFDEPTNHLDIFAQEWFMRFLKRAPFGFLLVCHERAFLNESCNEILELSRGNAKRYKGNYENYLTQKKIDDDRQLAAYMQQQKEIADKKTTIARFKAKASKARMAKSMQKQMEKVELLEPPEREAKIVSISFPPTERPERCVLRVHNLSKTFEDNTIFKNVNFRIERNNKVALVAANGVGKTTLFKLITGEYPNETGSIHFGNAVNYAIFKQDQNTSLDLKSTIWDEVAQSARKKTEREVRSFLGSFLFPGDDVYKTIGVLSGGEKNRVSMIKTLLQASNVLLLDEPTNHLDIQSKEVLLKALQNYPGTILFVSHDQDFVNRLATHIIELTPNGTDMYPGNYDDYIAQKNHANEEPTKIKNSPIAQAKAKEVATKEERKKKFEAEKNIKKLANKIEKLEEWIASSTEKLGNFEFGTPEFTEIYKKIEQLQKNLETATASWEEAQIELDT